MINIWFGNEDGPPPLSRPVIAEPNRLATSVPPRILIVEDELFVAWQLEAIVQDLHFEVCGLIPDGEQALEKARELDPNVILMDLNLGGQIDGIDAAQEIRRYRKTSIIFVTAYTDEATLRRIKAAFPEAPVLAKPVSPNELSRAIAAVLKRGD